MEDKYSELVREINDEYRKWRALLRFIKINREFFEVALYRRMAKNGDLEGLKEAYSRAYPSDRAIKRRAKELKVYNYHRRDAADVEQEVLKIEKTRLLRLIQHVTFRDEPVFPYSEELYFSGRCWEEPEAVP